MIERIIEACARNRGIVLLAVLGGIAWGVFSLSRLPLDAIPDLSDIQVIVFTEWQGRSPDLVEDQITYPLVTSMLAAPKVKVVRGYSYFGLSFVYIIFEDGTDLYWARSRVLEYLSEAQKDLPSGVTPTLGPDATGVGWVYQYVLTDTTGRHDLAELRTLQDWYVRYWLESVPGVAEVASVGGFEKQYQVEVHPNTLAAYNIPLHKLMNAIRESNNDVGGRVLEQAGTEFVIRGRGYITSLEDVEDIVVGTDGAGTPVLMRDVARVSFGPQMRRGAADWNGQGEVVGGIIVMRYGENALDVITRVKEKIAQVRPSLPEGVELVEVYDRSGLILASIATLRNTLLEEGLVVSCVIALFLWHVRSALVAIITLPIAVLLSFIPMYYLGLNSNIMSLGGIAIAIGAMVDAAVVLIENAHKRIEQAPDDADRMGIIVAAAKEVGRPIFFALLIITVSFMPVFTLEAQEGRLFKPLAFTKTFGMFFAAILSITLAPALMGVFIRGRIQPESRNPINRGLGAVLAPAMRWALRRRRAALVLTGVALATAVPVFQRIGSEFMPPLNEGVILYMPVTVPGISIEAARDLLQRQDQMLKHVPEVDTVFGKVGRARTSTDPAPLSMVETIINLKPRDHWRPGLTWDGLIAELDAMMTFPGVTNAWTMPIKARTDMLSTGIRTPIGIKVFGPNLETIGHLGLQLENMLQHVPGTRSVFAERVTGGHFLDITPHRKEIARYGLTVEQVAMYVETAVGGMTVDTTVEGRERYTINVRYPRDYRDSPDALKRVLVSTPTGAQIPLGQLADIQTVGGPPVIKDENGMLTGWVYIDVVGRDIGSYVEEAKQRVYDKLEIPSGYYLSWAGQYEYLQRIHKRLAIVVPITIGVILVLLYISTRSVSRTILIMITAPFAVMGGIWLLAALGYNTSIAVWVGVIALVGVATQTGIIMITFLDEACARYHAEGRLTTRDDVREAVLEGAGHRIRPVIMTATVMIIGLTPILWSTGAGADVMRRIAAPMIGGLVTSTLLTLFILPVLYYLWRCRAIADTNTTRSESAD